MKKLVLLTTISMFSIFTRSAVSYTVTLDYNKTYYTSPYATEKEKGPHRFFMVTIRVDGKTEVKYQPVEAILPKKFSVKNNIAIDVVRFRPGYSGSKITYYYDPQQLVNNKIFPIEKNTRITLAFGPGKKINFYTGTVNFYYTMPDDEFKKKAKLTIKQNNKNVPVNSWGSGYRQDSFFGFKNIKPGSVEVTIKHKRKSGGKIFNITRGDYGIYIHKVTKKEALVGRYYPHQHKYGLKWLKPVKFGKKYKIPLN